MTRIINPTVKCACCGKMVKVRRLMSYSSMSVTLDGKKDDLHRYMLEVCPQCKYPSLNITKETKINPSLVNRLYQKEANHIIKDELFLPFIVAGNIYESNKEYLDAEYMFRAASWICLNENQVNLSNIYKRRCCTNIMKYFETLDGMTMKDISIAVILVDTYRQSGNLRLAKELSVELLRILDECDNPKELNNKKYYKKLINFEMKLIDNRNFNIHFLNEVV